MKSNDITISIGIPAFNGGPKLVLAVASALANSSLICEVIVTDDGDNFEALSGFQDPRLKYFKNPVPLGMWSNFVEVASRASGRYFCWLGEDDYICPSFGNVISSCIRRCKGEDFIALMGIPTEHSDRSGSRPTRLIIRPDCERSAYMRVLDVFASNGWGASFYAVFDTKAISLYPLKLLAGYPSHKWSLDYVWMMHLAIHGNIKLIPQEIYYKDQSNWKNRGAAIKEVQWHKGLLYLLGVLSSIECIRDGTNIEMSQSQFERIIQMVISKYMMTPKGGISQYRFRDIGELTLKSYIEWYADLLDGERHEPPLNPRVRQFCNDILLTGGGGGRGLKSANILKLLEKKIVDLAGEWRYHMWLRFPDFFLKLRKLQLLCYRERTFAAFISRTGNVYREADRTN